MRRLPAVDHPVCVRIHTTVELHLVKANTRISGALIIRLIVCHHQLHVRHSALKNQHALKAFTEILKRDWIRGIGECCTLIFREGKRERVCLRIIPPGIGSVENLQLRQIIRSAEIKSDGFSKRALKWQPMGSKMSVPVAFLCFSIEQILSIECPGFIVRRTGLDGDRARVNQFLGCGLRPREQGTICLLPEYVLGVSYGGVLLNSMSLLQSHFGMFTFPAT